jgi:hypothetical protein
MIIFKLLKITNLELDKCTISSLSVSKQHIPIELEVNDTTYTDRSVSYLDLHLEIDIEEGLRTKFPDNKKRFKFSHCELSIYIYQHCSGACIWSKYLSVDPIFQSLWLLSGFP